MIFFNAVVIIFGMNRIEKQSSGLHLPEKGRYLYRAAAFDLEGVLVKDEPSIWQELFKAVGQTDLHKAIKEKYKDRNDLESKIEWKNAQVEALVKAGLKKETFMDIIESRQLVDDAEVVVRAYKLNGFKTAIISGGILQEAEMVQKKLGIDYVAAMCSFVFDENGVLKGWKALPSDCKGKVSFFNDFIHSYGISSSEAIYYGHDVNDLWVYPEAGLSIIVNPKSEAARQSALVSVGSLTKSLDNGLIKK